MKHPRYRIGSCRPPVLLGDIVTLKDRKKILQGEVKAIQESDFVRHDWITVDIGETELYMDARALTLVRRGI